MYWVLQENLFNEYGYTQLLETLNKYDIPHTEVKIVPFIHDIIPDINPEGLVMVCGATSMTKIANRKNWFPGSFHNEDFTYEKWKENWGTELLNYEAIVCRFDEVAHHWDEFFIRPCEDTKSFSGTVMEWEEFYEWQPKVVGINEDLSPLQADTMVMMSPLKTIYTESRFFVVDGKVITGSIYKVGNTVRSSDIIDDDLWNYTQSMVDIWQPARAFVLDVALTPDGFKIIEVNNLNSAGYYKCDIQKIVLAIENMEFNSTEEQ